MRRILKVFALLAVVFLLLLGGAALYIKIKFPPERVKAMVIAEAEKALRRKVEVRSVSLGLWSGLRLEGVRISERPDFSKGEFLTADAFLFRLALRPLLRKEIAVSELSLEGLRAQMIKGKDGKLNISDITEGAQKEETRQETVQSAAPAAAAALQADAIRLKNAELRYKDLANGAETVLRVPLVAVDGFRLSGKFGFSALAEIHYQSGKEKRHAAAEAKGTADLGGLEPAKLEASIDDLSLKSEGFTLKGRLNFQNASAPRLEGELGTVALDAKALSALVPSAPPGLNVPALKISFSAAHAPPVLSVKSFKLETAGLNVSGTLDIPDITAKEPRINLEAVSNTFEIAPLAEIHPLTRGRGISGSGAFKLSAKGPAAAPDIPMLELKLQLAPLKHETLKALFADDKGKSPVPEGLSLPPVKLDLAASKRADVLEIKTASLALGDLLAKAAGKISAIFSGDPAFRLSIETGDISFAAFAPYIKSVSQLGGKARLLAEASGTVSAPKIAGTLDLKSAGAHYLGQKLENLTGLIRFTDTSLELPQLTGTLNGGDLTLSFSAQHPDPKTAVVTVKGTISSLDAGALEALASHAPGAQSAPASTAKPQLYAGPVLRTSGELSAGKITHPNFSSGKAALRWNLTGVTPEFKLMNGSARLDVGSGKMIKLLALAKQKGGLLRSMVAPLEALEKARKLGIPGLNVPSLDEVPFDKIVGDYAFTGGVMTMQPSLLEGPTLRAETIGPVDLPASKLDLKIAMRALGLGSFNLTVKGPMDDPSIRPEIPKEFQEKASELLKEEGKKLLRGLLGK